RPQNPLPKPRRPKLEEIPAGTAEIDAVPATPPVVASFDCHAARSEMPFPPRKLVLADGERHVQHALPAMPGNGPARQDDGLRRGTLEKDQKHIAPRHGKGR